MKRIFTLIAVAMGLMLPMQAQFAPISKDIKAHKGIERKMMRKAPAAEITVEDIEGIYAATASTALQNTQDPVWDVTIYADDEDANKVWIQPIGLVNGLPSEYVNPVYATFNASDATLTMPLGQMLYEEEGLGLAIGQSADGRTIDTKGNVVMNITVDNKATTISFAADYYFGIGDVFNNEWWYAAVFNVVFTKAVPVPYVYIYNKGEENPIHVKASQLYFNDVEGEMCVTTTPEIISGIEGAYEAYAESAFEGVPAEEWTITVTRDNADANKFWLQPICSINGLMPEDISPVYAIYDESKGTLAMPLGQVVFQGSGYKMVMGASADGKNVETTGDYMFAYEDNSIYSDDNRVIGVGDMNDPDGWWYNAYMGYVFAREASKAYPVANIERITREKPEIKGGFTYIKPGNYTWSIGLPVSETELETVTSTTTFTAGEAFDLGEVLEEGAGMSAMSWTITGFLAELGLYEDGGEAYPLNTYSFTITEEDMTAEVLSFHDKDNFYCTLGKVMMQDQAGNPVAVEIMIGDIQAGYLVQPNFIALSENEIEFGGEQLALFYIQGDGAYLFAELYEVTAAPATDAAAPMRIKANIGPKATVVGQGTALKLRN